MVQRPFFVRAALIVLKKKKSQSIRFQERALSMRRILYSTYFISILTAWCRACSHTKSIQNILSPKLT